ARESRGRELSDHAGKPDVPGMRRVGRTRRAARLPLPRDGDVLEPGTEQPPHFVATDLGLDGERARADAVEHGVAVPAEAEEVIPLLRGDQVERGVLDAVAVDDLRAGLELLAAGAVQALVFRLEQVVGLAGTDAPEQR